MRRIVMDDQLIRDNSLGLPLVEIAKHYDCHLTTVANRLRELGINPADTRRSFMSDILVHLTETQKDWLADQLGPGIDIKAYVKNLILKEYISQNARK